MFTLTVTGANFLSSSTVQWNGTARTTTFVSSTELQAAITAADIATAGTAGVTVLNPAPGGGTSSAATFTINNPAPTLGSLSPNSAFAGTAAFTLSVGGTNFVSSSTVQWNGSPRTTTFVSNIELHAAITPTDIATSGSAIVTVSSPAPGGGISAPLSFTIQTATPAITSLNPGSAIVGGPSFPLTVVGTDFFPTSSIQWNGSPLSTTFISSTQLQASITAADIAAIGTAQVTVVNPGTSGGTSAPSSFFVGQSGGANFAVIELNQSAQDIVFDPVNKVFYLSVAGTAANFPNTIAVLNPTTGTISTSVPAGSNPDVLAISGDNQFLYAGIDGTSSVQRFILPALSKDISYQLTAAGVTSPLFALDLQVAPGAPHTTAVSMGAQGEPAAQGGVKIFDDATARPNSALGWTGGGGLYGSLQWNSDATMLYAANNEDTGFDFYKLAVNANGVTPVQDFLMDFSNAGPSIHFDPTTSLVYADEGHVINPATGLPAANFNTLGLMVPDSTLNSAFFATGLVGSSAVSLESFDLTHFTPIASVGIPNVLGNPAHLIRWGQNGLAFITSGGQVFLIGGNFVSLAPPFVTTPPPTPAPLPTPAVSAPTISSLKPSAAVVGSTSMTVTVNGTNFVSSSSVQWNANPVTTTFVSSTQLQATITTADLSAVGAASITVVNPAADGGTSSPSSFFIGSNGGMSSNGTGYAVTVLNQTVTDIVSDPLNRVIYLSVPSTVPNGNTIAVLDPSSMQIVGDQFAGSNPDILAISDDSQFLYVGIDGASSVRRFTLPNLGQDISYTLGADSFFGPNFALDVQVAPGIPHTTAVTMGNATISPEADGGISIFDDGIARSTRALGFSGSSNLYDSLQWGSDATALFAANYESSGYDFYTLTVNASGVTVDHDYPNTFITSGGLAFRIHFDRGTHLVYSDAGYAITPSTGAIAGKFNVSGPMVPDSTLNTAFFVVAASGSSTFTIESLNLTTYALVSSFTIPNLSGTPLRLIRWGQNGLAFNTDAGELVFVGGNFVH